MKKNSFFFLLVLPIFFVGLFSQKGYGYTDPYDSLVGDYSVVGKNNIASPKSYEGIARITKCGDNYTIEWQIGNSYFEGFGIRYGDILACSYRGKGNRLAVIVFNIEWDNTLNGVWAYEGSNQVKVEILTPR